MALILISSPPTPQPPLKENRNNGSGKERRSAEEAELSSVCAADPKCVLKGVVNLDGFRHATLGRSLPTFFFFFFCLSPAELGRGGGAVTFSSPPLCQG